MQEKANALQVITPIHGLPEILPLLSKVGAVPRDLLYNASAPAIAQHTVHNISDTIESDLEWPTPTNDVRPIVIEPLRMVAPRL
jgi:hypothetical protein